MGRWVLDKVVCPGPPAPANIPLTYLLSRLPLPSSTLTLYPTHPCLQAHHILKPTPTVQPSIQAVPGLVMSHFLQEVFPAPVVCPFPAFLLMLTVLPRDEGLRAVAPSSSSAIPGAGQWQVKPLHWPQGWLLPWQRGQPSAVPAPWGLPDPTLAETGPRTDLWAGLGWAGRGIAGWPKKGQGMDGWLPAPKPGRPALSSPPPNPRPGLPPGGLFALALGQGRPASE